MEQHLQVTAPAKTVAAKPEPIWLTATFWKRAAVVFSIALSIVSLVLSAVASLKTESKDVLRAITISSIVINALSVSLSAITSLDWQKEETHDRVFAEHLVKIAHVHEGNEQNVVVTGRTGKRGEKDEEE